MTVSIQHYYSVPLTLEVFIVHPLTQLNVKYISINQLISQHGMCLFIFIKIHS